MDEEVPELNATDLEGRTSLHHAICKGDYAGIAKVLEYKPNKNIQDKNGLTPLHLATIFKDSGAVKLLLESLYLPATKVDVPDIDQQNALHMAADQDSADIVQQLLDGQANPNAQDKNRQTPLHIAATKGCEEIVEKLLKKRADPKKIDDKNQTPLHCAAEKGFLPIVNELLGNGKADALALDKDSKTALHLAANQGHHEVVKKLLDNNRAAKDKQDKSGKPPIYYAASQGHEDATKILKEAKANMEIANGQRQTLLYQLASVGNERAVELLINGELSANINAQDMHSNPPLYAAAKGNHRSIVQLLARQENIDKEAKNDDDGQTILHRVAGEGSEEAIQLLLEIKPEIEKDALDKAGQTPLYVAAKCNHKGAVRLLVCDNNSRLYTKDNTGGTLLHRAAREGHFEAVDLLADESANLKSLDGKGRSALELLDGKGRSALYVAAESDHKRIVSHLIDKYEAKTETLLHLAARERNHTAAKLLLGLKLGLDKVDMNAKDNKGQTPLHIAANHSREVVLILIEGYEANVNMKDEMGQTPLHRVAARGDDAVNMLELLIKKRANPDTTDKNGQSPLHAAAIRGDVNMVTKLLDVPAVKQAVNAADKNGQTPMHMAAKNGRAEVVLLLYNEGADKGVQDEEGKTPLHTAAQYGKSQVVAYFRGLPDWKKDRAARDKNGQLPLHLAAKISSDQATIEMLLDHHPYKVPSPQTIPQYHVHYRQFVADNLPGVFSPADPRVREYAVTAAERTNSAAEIWGLEVEDVSGLSHLWLYDFVILCDDSGPTKKNPPRIKALSDALQRVASVANFLKSSGIYVRFLKYSSDENGGFDHMTDGSRIARKVEKVYDEENDQDFKLGTVLQKKVVQPLVTDKIDKGEFNKPVLVYIIMDGNPQSEPEDAFYDTIRKCKDTLQEKGIGKAAVIFLVSQIGNSSTATDSLDSAEGGTGSSEATNFLEKIDATDLREMIHYSKEKSDEIMKSHEDSPEKFTAWLVKMFIKAVKSQSVPRHG